MVTEHTAVTSLIQSTVENIPGFSPQDQLLTLFTLAYVSKNVPGDILELGSWCGRSATALGLAARLSGKGHVYCVDLFPEKNDWYQNSDGTYSFSVTIENDVYDAYHNQKVWAEPFLKEIAPVYEHFSGALQAFLKAMEENALQNYVTAFKGDLIRFAKNAPADLALRLAFIDGDHSFDAVSKDIEIVERYLSPGGWICFDDAFSAYDGVNLAIEKHIIGSDHYDSCLQVTRKLFIARRKP